MTFDINFDYIYGDTETLYLTAIDSACETGRLAFF